MTGKEIRARFLTYFADRGHTVVASSSLIPHNDPTLLFANAGMNQFKDCFLGLEDRGYYRAASSQKCVRAGGKHNDLENVGRTARHHTFFEMLGNFSFGDYFKTEAIAFAWEFLTVDLGLDKSRLYVTVYQDDDEAADIWHHQEGVPRERIFRFGEKDNFWAMGDTGPCGPCTEIFWDNGPEVGCGSAECAVGCDCDRYMEIWNNVFMQFDRSADGKLTPLPKPAVDTGMGLERISTVMQGKQTNYDTDLFQGIIRHIEKLSGKRYGASSKDDVSMRVIADHARATTFLICDGALPSNEGRGYVLRRIMRRAARHAKMLGFAEPMLYRAVDAVNEMMADAYPELIERESYIKKVVLAEEERFIETLDNGLRILNEEMAALRKAGSNGHPRRDPLQALRHLRLPDRPDRRHRGQRRVHHRRGGLRNLHGAAAGAGTGALERLRRGGDRRHPQGAPYPRGPEPLRGVRRADRLLPRRRHPERGGGGRLGHCRRRGGDHHRNDPFLRRIRRPGRGHREPSPPAAAISG